MRPSRHPFHTSPAITLVEAWAHSQVPHLKDNVKFCLKIMEIIENMAILSSISSNWALIFVKQLRNLINYQFSSFCFWWKSAHKAPFSWQFICSQTRKVGNPGRTYLPEIKVECPPPPGYKDIMHLWLRTDNCCKDPGGFNILMLNIFFLCIIEKSFQLHKKQWVKAKLNSYAAFRLACCSLHCCFNLLRKRYLLQREDQVVSSVKSINQ